MMWSIRVGRAVLLFGVVAWSGCAALTSFDGFVGEDAAGGGPDESGAFETGADSGGPDSGGSDSVAGISYVATVLADSPVAYWRLGESSGTTNVKDLSGHGNDGIAFNCTAGSSGAIVSDPDTAMRFDGASSRIACGGNLGFAGKVPFSVEAWVNPAGGGDAFQHIVTEEAFNGPGGRQGYAIYLAPGSEVALERYVDGVEIDAIAPAVAPNQFVHLVGTYDGTTLSMYVNGVLAAVGTDTRATKAQPDPLYIGSGDTNESFVGVIDEVAVYDKALSPARILAHYHAAGR